MAGPTQPRSQKRRLRARLGAVSPAVDGPIPGGLVGGLLPDQLSRLVDVLVAEPCRPELAARLGAELVDRDITGEQSLERILETLGDALLRQPELGTVEGLASKIVSVLAALASGYTAALRRRALAERESWFRAVFDSAPIGMVISQLDGTITDTNGALREILHHPPAGLIGHDLSELFHPTDAARLRSVYQALTEGKPEHFPRRVKARTGRGDSTWVALTALVLRDPAGHPSHHVTVVEDVADRELLEYRVRHQALHDLLTGLPNRLHFASHLDSVLERDRSAPLLVCKLDLDCFGVVNEGLGLGFGDFLLRSVAERLRSLFAAEHAFLARFDDDEFALLIEESPSTPNAATLAARINAELSEPVYLAGRGLAVSACLGIVHHSGGAVEAKELIRAAEATLHRARRSGRGQWLCYDPAIDAEQRSQYRLATAMPEAWENGQLTLCYQPVLRLAPSAPDAGQVVALAALLRWNYPGHGVVEHEDCLALAEQTGLVLTIGPWMLRQACEQLRRWREELPGAVPAVRVDLTTYLTQDPDLVAVVHDALQAAHLRPEDIQLGMPVEVIIAGGGEAVDNVRTLAEIGVHTVMTRYGQALGNLVLLDSLPVLGVEIAGSLVRAAAGKPDSVVRSAVASILPLIRRAGVSVMVAGINEAEQASWWRQAGTDSARGAALAPPVAPEHIPALLRTLSSG